MDYFGFDILYVMNVTDIDDKIILRAHYNHLDAMLHAVREALEKANGAADKHDADDSARDGTTTTDTTVTTTTDTTTDSTTDSTTDADAHAQLQAAAASAEKALSTKGVPLADVVAAQTKLSAAAAAANMPPLPVCDVQTAFLKLTAEQEAAFFADMDALGVMPPDAVTRVTDYVPEIVEYIAAIQ
eukprot:2606754-Pleurochrysis_carterae.AAC.1